MKRALLICGVLILAGMVGASCKKSATTSGANGGKAASTQAAVGEDVVKLYADILESVKGDIPTQTKVQYGDLLQKINVSLMATSNEQLKGLIDYTQNEQRSAKNFLSELRAGVIERVIQNRDAPTIVYVLSKAPAYRVFGKYPEWVLENEVGNSGGILIEAYRKTESKEVKSTISEAFHRAFPEVEFSDNMNSNERDLFVEQCLTLYNARRETWVLNQKYIYPTPISSSIDEHIRIRREAIPGLLVEKKLE